MARSVYRFSSPRHDPWTTGSHEGRWNREGTPVIYTAESRALAKLEVLANRPARLTHTLSRCEIPSGVLPKAQRVGSVPSTVAESQDLTERWLGEGRSACLVVPSSVLSAERNLLLNPRHPDFSRLRWVIEERES